MRPPGASGPGKRDRLNNRATPHEHCVAVDASFTHAPLPESASAHPNVCVRAQDLRERAPR